MEYFNFDVKRDEQWIHFQIPHNDNYVNDGGANLRMYVRLVHMISAALGCGIESGVHDYEKMFVENAEHDHELIAYECEEHGYHHVLVNDTRRPLPSKWRKTVDPDAQVMRLISLDVDTLKFFGFTIDPYGVVHETEESHQKMKRWRSFRRANALRNK